jgi:muramoyltetrapeptide carboxypeptidase
VPDLRRPAPLQAGDLVRIVSPASAPTEEGVATGVELFQSWGLRVEVAPHVFDEHPAGFLAGADEHRIADLNDAFRDPEVRAVLASRGGKGAYRVVDGLDYAAIAADPKLVVGFSDVTILHLAILQRAGVAGLHGPMANWHHGFCGPESAEQLRRALFTTDPVVVATRPGDATGALTTTGSATGPLIGGNLDMVRTAFGSFLPDLAGAILLLEDPVQDQIGRVDRSLHQLRRAGVFDELAGIAVGDFGPAAPFRPAPGSWTIVDLLRDELERIVGDRPIPILGGLPLGHGLHPATVPIGPVATLDADAGTLVVEPATTRAAT